jgi:hypothetical protein
MNDVLEVLLQDSDHLLGFAPLRLRPAAELLRRHHLAVDGGGQCETERRTQNDDTLFACLVAQSGKGFGLLFSEILVDRPLRL